MLYYGTQFGCGLYGTDHIGRYGRIVQEENMGQYSTEIFRNSIEDIVKSQQQNEEGKKETNKNSRKNISKENVTNF
jgi:hypothetical protein